MAVLQYKDPVTGQMVDLPLASYGIKEAPKDGKQYVRQDGEWTNVSIEPGSPFMNKEYADIIALALEANEISQEDFDKLFEFAGTQSVYCETELYQNIYKINLFREYDGLRFYLKIEGIGFGGSYQDWRILPDRTISKTYERSLNINPTFGDNSINLTSQGDGLLFLSDNGEYAAPRALLNEKYGNMVVNAMSNGSILPDDYYILKNALTYTDVFEKGCLICEVYGEIFIHQMLLINTNEGIAIYDKTFNLGSSEAATLMTVSAIIKNDYTCEALGEAQQVSLVSSGDGALFLSDDGTYKEIKESEPFVNADYGKILKSASETGSITQDDYNLLVNAIASSTSNRLFCESEYVYGRLYFMAINNGYGTITVYMNSQMIHVSDPSFNSTVMTITPDLIVTNTSNTSITLDAHGDGDKFLSDDGSYKTINVDSVSRLRSYTTATTVASLDVNYENIYVTLTANASLSASATGADYNGRTITAYVYTAAARTITIPTTGNYISMCGSSFETTAGRWVEFNLTCINGIWHIAKLEQE